MLLWHYNFDILITSIFFSNLIKKNYVGHNQRGSDGTEQGLRAGQNIRTRVKKFSVVRTEHWSEHQNILK